MLIRNPYISLLLVSSASLLSAYFVEHIMQVKPCVLCIYERFPYLLFIFFSIISIASKKYKQCNTYLIIVAFGAIILASYHVAIEKGFFTSPPLCKPLIFFKQDMPNQEFIDFIYNQKISMCNKPSLVLFNISMAKLNLLLNVILLLSIVKYRNFQEI